MRAARRPSRRTQPTVRAGARDRIPADGRREHRRARDRSRPTNSSPACKRSSTRTRRTTCSATSRPIPGATASSAASRCASIVPASKSGREAGIKAECGDEARRKADAGKSRRSVPRSRGAAEKRSAAAGHGGTFSLAGRRESAVAIVVGVRQPIRPNQERHVERVDLQVSAYNVEGRQFGSKRLTANVAFRAGASGLGAYEVLSRLDLRPGRISCASPPTSALFQPAAASTTTSRCPTTTARR